MTEWILVSSREVAEKIRAKECSIYNWEHGTEPGLQFMLMATHRYGIKLLCCSAECHDAITPDWRKVQIKATQGKSVALRHEPERLIVLRHQKNGETLETYNGSGRIPWSQPGRKQSNGQRSISRSRFETL